MTERSAPPTSTPAPRPGASRNPGRPEPAVEQTAVRPPLTERIAARMSRATDEHRANATAPTTTKGKAATSPAAGTGAAKRPPRRARLRLTRVDPWSVMKTAFLLSIALGIVTVVSVLMVWSVLDAAGVWDSINKTVTDIVGDDASGFDIEDYIGTSRVLGFTVLVSVVDVVLLTAIATLGAFLYNMAAALLGGIEVTLAEDN